MSVFDSNNADTPASYLEELVGEGKKFQDHEALAKGKWEADKFAEQLKTELAELRAEAEVAKRVEEALLSRQQTHQNSNQDALNGAEANQPAKPATQEEIQELVRKTLKAEEQGREVKNNVENVASKLIEIYGDETKANEVVKAKAKELNVPLTFLQGIAAQSPKAFFATTGLDAPAASSAGPTHGDVNSRAFGAVNATKPNTYKWYQELRKANPAAYRNKDTQMQMHSDAQQMGDAFFS